MCPECEYFAVDLEIHGPAQLRRMVGKLQAISLDCESYHGSGGTWNAGSPP